MWNRNLPHGASTRTSRTSREFVQAQMASSGEGVCSSCDWLCGGEGRVCWRGSGPIDGGGRPSGGGGRMCGGRLGWRCGPPGGKRGGNMAPGGGGGAHTGETKRTLCHFWRQWLFYEQYEIRRKWLLTWHHGRSPRAPWRVKLRRWRSIRCPARKGTIHGAGSGSRRWWACHPWISFR